MQVTAVHTASEVAVAKDAAAERIVGATTSDVSA